MNDKIKSFTKWLKEQPLSGKDIMCEECGYCGCIEKISIDKLNLEP